MSEHSHCDNPACRRGFVKNRPWQRFCQPDCRRAAHRGDQVDGRPARVAGMRALKSGGWSVTLHIDGSSAPGLRPGDNAVIGYGDPA